MNHCAHVFGECVTNVCIRCGWDATSGTPDPNGPTVDDHEEMAATILSLCQWLESVPLGDAPAREIEVARALVKRVRSESPATVPS